MARCHVPRPTNQGPKSKAHENRAAAPEPRGEIIFPTRPLPLQKSHAKKREYRKKSECERLKENKRRLLNLFWDTSSRGRFSRGGKVPRAGSHVGVPIDKGAWVVSARPNSSKCPPPFCWGPRTRHFLLSFPPPPRQEKKNVSPTASQYPGASGMRNRSRRKGGALSGCGSLSETVGIRARRRGGVRETLPEWNMLLLCREVVGGSRVPDVGVDLKLGSSDS